MTRRYIVGLGFLLSPLCVNTSRAQADVAPAANEKNAISVSVRLPYRAPYVFLVAARVLGELGYAVADSSSARGALSTSPSYEWPAGSEAEKWHDKESPGVVLQVIVSASSADSTFFGVTAIAPVRTVDGGDAAANTLRTLSALRVAGRVSELLKDPVVPTRQ